VCTIILLYASIASYIVPMIHRAHLHASRISPLFYNVIMTRCERQTLDVREVRHRTMMMRRYLPIPILCIINGIILYISYTSEYFAWYKRRSNQRARCHHDNKTRGRRRVKCLINIGIKRRP